MLRGFLLPIELPVIFFEQVFVMLPYVGRFAPSPSGPLHFGSLVCALVSFLHARQANGQWLLRIEDVDTTRVKADADQIILSQLISHGMRWDGDVIYQTNRQHEYQKTVDILHKRRLVYACSCTRKAVKARGKYYAGTCRNLHLPFKDNALRLINTSHDYSFHDLHLGSVFVEPFFCREDLSIQRKDGLFTYNLAVVVDDIEHQVTHVVRGADLIDTTLQQQHIYRLLYEESPKYFHLPVICLENGKKLSKQNHALAIENKRAVKNLIDAFAVIGLSNHSLSEKMTVEDLINWAIKHWSPNLLAKKREILLSGINTV
ncbi:MAG: glutamyl-Q tRNA(Asp) synthetase [Gammaproteobacteria bacterium]|jgi:glutamyl-Q tRNA(Asp) synthetase